jgi:hypothetical protein
MDRLHLSHILIVGDDELLDSGDIERSEFDFGLESDGAAVADFIGIGSATEWCRFVKTLECN